MSKVSIVAELEVAPTHASITSRVGPPGPGTPVALRWLERKPGPRPGWQRPADPSRSGWTGGLGPRRLVDDARGVLRWIHGDRAVAGSLASLVPVPEDPFARFDLSVTLPAGWRLTAHNGSAVGSTVRFADVRRWEPYLVAHRGPAAADVQTIAVGGSTVAVTVLGAGSETLPAADVSAALEALGARLGPLPDPEVTIDLVPPGSVHARFGSMEHPGIVRSTPADLAHELVHLWIGGRVGPADASVWWFDEAVAALLTRPTLPAYPGPRAGLAAAGETTPRLAYDYGAWALSQRFAGEPERLFEALRRLVAARVPYNAAALERAGLTGLERWVTPTRGDDRPPAETEEENRFAKALGGPSGLVAAAARAELFEGPLFVLENGRVRAIGYRTVDANDDEVEWWTMTAGFRLGPQASGSSVTRTMHRPSGTFEPDDWEDFLDDAQGRILVDFPNATFDDFHHVVT